MKKKVTRFKNLKTALKVLEPYIRDGKHLQTGKPFRNFENGRSRELLANWLLCVAINAAHKGERLTFSSDADGDGNIVDTVSHSICALRLACNSCAACYLLDTILPGVDNSTPAKNDTAQ